MKNNKKKKHVTYNTEYSVKCIGDCFDINSKFFYYPKATSLYFPLATSDIEKRVTLHIPMSISFIIYFFSRYQLRMFTFFR